MFGLLPFGWVNKILIDAQLFTDGKQQEGGPD